MSSPKPLRVLCSWCGALIREGALPVSHGTCPPCVDEQLAEIERGIEQHHQDRLREGLPAWTYRDSVE